MFTNLAIVNGGLTTCIYGVFQPTYAFWDANLQAVMCWSLKTAEIITSIGSSWNPLRIPSNNHLMKTIEESMSEATDLTRIKPHQYPVKNIHYYESVRTMINHC